MQYEQFLSFFYAQKHEKCCMFLHVACFCMFYQITASKWLLQLFYIFIISSDKEVNQSPRGNSLESFFNLLLYSKEYVGHTCEKFWIKFGNSMPKYPFLFVAIGAKPKFWYWNGTVISQVELENIASQSTLQHCMKEASHLLIVYPPFHQNCHHQTAYTKFNLQFYYLSL